MQRIKHSASIDSSSSDKSNSVDIVKDRQDQQQDLESDDSKKTNQEQVYIVEQVLDIRTYKNKSWVLIKWEGYEEPTWESKGNCDCSVLIQEFREKNTALNKSKTKKRKLEEERNVWDVEQILDKRTVKDKTEYLVRWKGWPGEPTWEPEENVIDSCHNLVAQFECPKLAKMFNFSANNKQLWLTQKEMFFELNKIVSKHPKVNLLKFAPDNPKGEKPLDLKEGLNIGAVSFHNHWYLIIVTINYLTVTKKILICDSLNVLLGRSPSFHPLYLRLKRVYAKYPINCVRMSQMMRSDMCAFYTIAAFERAIFLLDERAPFVVNEIQIDEARAEQLRDEIKPDILSCSISLPPSEEDLSGPYCEFCKDYYNTIKNIDKHITEKHFKVVNYID